MCLHIRLHYFFKGNITLRLFASILTVYGVFLIKVNKFEVFFTKIVIINRKGALNSGINIILVSLENVQCFETLSQCQHQDAKIKTQKGLLQTTYWELQKNMLLCCCDLQAESGKLKVTLDYPDYYPCQKFAKKSATRKTLEKAFHSRFVINSNKFRKLISDMSYYETYTVPSGFVLFLQ